MKSIQEAGKEILTNNPSKMYVFTGEEYGIKKRYLSILSSYYGSSKEYEKVEDVLSIFRSKRLIKLQPCLYIVRYDEDFIKSLNDRSENDIRKLNICGTIVLLYENSKQSSKLEKYLPSYTTSVDSVNINFMVKYILSEFKTCQRKLQEMYVKYLLTMGKHKTFHRVCHFFLPKNQETYQSYL